MQAGQVAIREKLVAAKLDEGSEAYARRAKAELDKLDDDLRELLKDVDRITQNEEAPTSSTG